MGQLTKEVPHRALGVVADFLRWGHIHFNVGHNWSLCVGSNTKSKFCFFIATGIILRLAINCFLKCKYEYMCYNYAHTCLIITKILQNCPHAPVRFLVSFHCFHLLENFFFNKNIFHFRIVSTTSGKNSHALCVVDKRRAVLDWHGADFHANSVCVIFFLQSTINWSRQSLLMLQYYCCWCCYELLIKINWWVTWFLL